MKKIIGGFTVLLLIIGVSICGCMEDNKNQAKGLINLIPENYNGFVYVSFKNIENSEYASEYRSKILNSLGMRTNGGDNGEKTGIYLNKTKDIIITANNENYRQNVLIIIGGDYDFDKFKKYLKEEKNISPTENYKGFEIYPIDNRYDLVLTFYNDKIISGTKSSVYDCIDVIKGDKESISKNEKVMEIFDKLPSDACIMMVAAKKSWDGTIARGYGITLKNNDRVKAYVVEKYEDKESAQKKYEELIKHYEKEKKQNPEFDANIKLDGVFVIGTVEGPAKELKL
jgi:tetratricopeptide (TPR) repeat protein